MKDREHNGQMFEDNKSFNQKTHINEGQRTQWQKVWKYQRDNQKTQINEGQRTQWPKVEDTKGLIRRHKSMKDENTMAKIWKYQRVNQMTQINEGQRTQWPKVWR